jgi:hypothetical protein
MEKDFVWNAGRSCEGRGEQSVRRQDVLLLLERLQGQVRRESRAVREVNPDRSGVSGPRDDRKRHLGRWQDRRVMPVNRLRYTLGGS